MNSRQFLPRSSESVYSNACTICQKSCSTDPGRSAGTSEIRFLKAASATVALPSLVAFLMSDSSSAGFSHRSTNARIFFSMLFLSGTLLSGLFLSALFFLSVAMTILSPGHHACPAALSVKQSKKSSPGRQSRQNSARQGRRSHQALVDRARALAALADRPHDQRRAAPHVTRGEPLRHPGLLAPYVGQGLSAPFL